ncbi:hypothetical protein PQX77_019932 [Marasmius sp. AFHP31]|nr:hypothetical protein PQX77_019932 [Marasmius sp. AFHP31]
MEGRIDAQILMLLISLRDIFEDVFALKTLNVFLLSYPHSLVVREMISRRPFLFILSFPLKHSASFGIARILPQAKPNDVVTLLPSQLEVDPTSFIYAAAPTSYSNSEDGMNVGTAKVEKEMGTMESTSSKDDGYDTVSQLGILLTSKIMGIFAVDAYDTGTLSASELQRRGEGCITGPIATDTLPTCHIGGGGGLFGEPTGLTGGLEGPDNSPSDSPSALTHPTLSPPARTTPPASTVPTVPINTATSTTIATTTPLASGGQDGTPNDSSHGPASDSSPASILVTASTPPTQNPNLIGGGSAQQVSKPPGAGRGSVQTGGNSGPANLANSSQQPPPATPTETSATPPIGTPPITRNPNIGTIIGPVLGALLLLILVLLVILCYRRRRKHRQDKSWKSFGRHNIFFNEKMVKQPDDESIMEETQKAHGDDRGLFGYSIFPSKAARQKDTDGMSSVDSLTSDLPLSTAYTYTISEYESDSSSTITAGLSEVSTDVKGGGYEAGARTDRQMEIEGNIFELQREIIELRAAGADASDVMRLRERIERLRQVQGEKWAMEVTDEVPPEMVH